MYIVLINHLDGRDVDVDDLRGVGPVVQQAAAHAALGRADCVRVTFVWSFWLLKQLTHVYEYIYEIYCLYTYICRFKKSPTCLARRRRAGGAAA